MARRKLDPEAAKARLAAIAEAQAKTSTATPPSGGDAAAYTEVPLAAVVPNPHNVRDGLGDLTELVESVRAQGVLQPLVVRPVADGERADLPEGARYVVVMGHRRLAALAETQAVSVPVVVRSDLTVHTDRRSMLVENLQRQDLSPLEEARAFRAEMDASGISQRSLAKQIGVTQAHVSRRLALLGLDDKVKDAIADGRIGVDVAVNEVVHIPAQHQAELVERLELEGGGPDGVRRVAQRMHVELEAREAEAAQLAEIERRGAIVVTDRVKHVGRDHWSRLVRKDADLDRLAEAGLLGGAVNPYGRVEWYDLTPREEAAEKREDPYAKEARLWREKRKHVEAWVATHPKAPRGGELVGALAGFVASTMSHDVGSQVHKWLRGSVGADVDDYYAWKDSLTEKDYPRVAWFATVAQDMYESRHATRGAAAGRTRDRIKEVK